MHLLLLALAALDATDGRRHRRIFPARWWLRAPRPRGDRGTAGGNLVGPNTSDDGYLLTMSRVAQNSDYTANYFRWYGAPGGTLRLVPTRCSAGSARSGTAHGWAARATVSRYG